MRWIQRYLESSIVTDALASDKMAFVSGPRQCGKTTMAESILRKHGTIKNYFNWDDDEFRRLWVSSPRSILERLDTIPNSKPLVVLDELHKHSRWKNSLKGLYDLEKGKISILVTGSARLDFYRKSGDSLAGRYLPYRLHPFSFGETDTIKAPPEKEWIVEKLPRFDYHALFTLGGFPEPLLGGSQAKAERWSRLQREQIIREDVRDLQAVRDLQLVETMAALLPFRVGSPLSLNSLREDLRVSFSTAKNWLGLFEAVYYGFLIPPYSKRMGRALQKEPKLYLFDWTLVKNPACRFENMVACHLLKSCHLWTDIAMGEFELRYVRDKEKREVDFLILKNGNPYLLAEVKLNERTLSPSLEYYSEKLKPEFAFQVVHEEPGVFKQFLAARRKIFLMDGRRFLAALN